MKTDATRMIDLGEVDWRAYRRALLAQLPHSWQRREDTRLQLAHFSKKKVLPTLMASLHPHA